MTARADRVGEVVERLGNRSRDGETGWVVEGTQRPDDRLTCNQVPLHPGGAASLINGIQQGNTLRGERIYTTQVEDEWLFREDEAPDVLADALDIRLVDLTTDRDHQGQVTTLRPDQGAIAVTCRIAVSEGNIRSWFGHGQPLLRWVAEMARPVADTSAYGLKLIRQSKAAGSSG